MLKLKNFFKHKLKKSKLILLIRATLIASVLFLFYIRFLLSATPEPDLNQLNEKLIQTSNTKRKLLFLNFPDLQYQKPPNCSEPAILEFPPDGFTKEQRQHGWIIVHIVVMFYGFWFLATISDDYLVPSIEQICSSFNIDRDVIGATLMAAAVASPELFMNFIGTFVTKGDIGVAAIVGSAVFNVLAVPACCGLFVATSLKLNWWPITRDCLMYLVSVFALLGILSDGQVWWYEALSLILAYFGYMLIMYYNAEIFRRAKGLLRRLGYYKPQYKEVNEFTGLLSSSRYNNKEPAVNCSHMMLYLEQQEKEEIIASPWSCRNQTFVEFFFRWPMTFLLWFTVPDSRKNNSLKYLTFILSIVWIGGVSYIVAFVITVIGDTLNIPDAVMGLTILAFGTSIPEAVSSVIVTRQGQGCMGMSNSLGSNTFDILLSFGLPWFIKTYFLPEVADQKFLQFDSSNLLYAGIILVTTLMGLYLLLVCNKFTLNRQVGVSCLIMYVIFMIVTLLIELNVFFPVNLYKCTH